MQSDREFDYVADDFLHNIRRGGDADSVVAQLRQDHAVVLEDPAKTILFVTTLAQAAWQAGVLTPALQEEALRLIGVAQTHHPDIFANLRQMDKTLRDPQPAAPAQGTSFWRSLRFRAGRQRHAS